jgi:fructose-bisphosphate aldolase class II
VDTASVVTSAYRAGMVVPAFNVPYLPMIEPVIQAIVDQDCFALIEVARLEWTKFQAVGPGAVMKEFLKWRRPDYVGIHLDHIPVIDEDGFDVDYLPIIQEAIRLGYGSVMVDGSRLDLEHNVRATRQAVETAHGAGIPCEAELGAVLGHEAGPLPPYEELFRSGTGFTDVEQAARFVRETGCDWLSVAIGNIHGAISASLKDKKKAEARLNLDRLDQLRAATGIPLVLHGGSGVRQADVLAAVKKGIAKVNVGTEVRQAYESALSSSPKVLRAQQAVYDRTAWLIHHYFGLTGTRRRIVEGLA